jgi:uncharacterized membrane protein YfcA
MTGLFALLCLIFAARFAFPTRFGPMKERSPAVGFPIIAGAAIGLSSGLAGVGCGILTNIIMALGGMPMHKSIGRAAPVGVVGQPAGHLGCSVRAGAFRANAAGQYRPRGVGVSRASAGPGSMVWSAAGALPLTI